MEVRWLASTSASAMHATAALLAGNVPVYTNLGTALAREVQGLKNDLDGLGLSHRPFCQHLVPCSARFDAPRELADVTLAKAFGRGHAAGSAGLVASRLTAIQMAFHESNPQALDELELRSQPLRDQWDAAGAGLLAAVSAAIDDECLFVEVADVILVQPVLGGGGVAHPSYNSIRIEAVLYNPLPDVPEIVRLGWLLAQLNLDLPKYQGNMLRDRLYAVGRFAFIPPLLTAAHEVELARHDSATLQSALSHWLTQADGLERAIEPVRLLEWWDTYQADKPPWPVALGALDNMLTAEAA